MTHREEKSLICHKDCRLDLKPGHLDCKVYEVQPTELATEPAVFKGKTEVRGLVPFLLSSLESELGQQEETVHEESRAKEQCMLDCNSSTVIVLWSMPYRVSFNPPCLP